VQFGDVDVGAQRGPSVGVIQEQDLVGTVIHGKLFGRIVDEVPDEELNSRW
jgi:hypothetical protein